MSERSGNMWLVKNGSNIDFDDYGGKIIAHNLCLHSCLPLDSIHSGAAASLLKRRDGGQTHGTHGQEVTLRYEEHLIVIILTDTAIAI